MPSVTAAFARRMTHAAGLELTSGGAVLDGKRTLYQMAPAQSGRVSEVEYYALIEWLRQRTPERAPLVSAYAGVISPDDLGPLGLAIKCAPRLRESLQRAARYYRLVTDTVRLTLDEGDLALFSLHGLTEDHPALHLRNECALAGFVAAMRTIAGADVTPDHVAFRHDAAGDPAQYVEIFGCPVTFGADGDVIALQPATLDLPNRLGDAGLSQFLTAHLKDLMHDLPEDLPIRDRLLRELAPRLSNGVPAAPDVARAMGMSERTLYRKLADAGLTYRDALHHAQLSLARDLLSGRSCSIAEIAFMTGFSEQSSFSRAFKRWEGKTPAQYRAQS